MPDNFCTNTKANRSSNTAKRKKKDIPDEIEVAAEFRDIFTDRYSLIGNKGRMINEFRTEHKKNPNRYRGRKKYSLKY